MLLFRGGLYLFLEQILSNCHELALRTCLSHNEQECCSNKIQLIESKYNSTARHGVISNRKVIGNRPIFKVIACNIK